MIRYVSIFYGYIYVYIDLFLDCFKLSFFSGNFCLKIFPCLILLIVQCTYAKYSNLISSFSYEALREICIGLVGEVLRLPSRCVVRRLPSTRFECSVHINVSIDAAKFMLMLPYVFIVIVSRHIFYLPSLRICQICSCPRYVIRRDIGNGIHYTCPCFQALS